MNKTIQYIKEVFGLDLNLFGIPKNKMGNLPFYLTHEYNFWEGKLMDQNVVLAEKMSNEHFTPDQYRKQLEILEQQFNIPVIFILPEMEAYQRNRLIQKRINFIIAGKLIFIPSLLINIHEYALKARKKEYLTPVAQCLILYHLQVEPLNNYTYKKLNEELRLNYLTITRAVENLQTLDLCTVTGTKERTISFELGHAELWEKALPYMKNPVVKSVFADYVLDVNLACRSNINALAYYTDLNDEQQIYMAVHQNVFRQLVDEGIIKDINPFEGKYCIELWTYTPTILTNKGFVDPLSVYLQFKDNTDERIKLALKTIIQQHKW